VQTGIVVGSLNIVAAFGGLVAGKAADVFGRKPTIALACAVFIAGAAIMSISEGFWLLLIGRIITGVGVGCAMVSLYSLSAIRSLQGRHLCWQCSKVAASGPPDSTIETSEQYQLEQF
jgi:MFS family permease